MRSITFVARSAFTINALLWAPLACTASDLTPAIQFDPDSPAIGFTSPPSFVQDTALQLYGPGVAFGWDFELTEEAIIAGVGVYDGDGDGLNGTYYVGLWRVIGPITNDPDFELVFTQEVASGVTAELADGFRTSGVPSTLLEPGHYAVGSFTIPDFSSLPEPLRQSSVEDYLADPTQFIGVVDPVPNEAWLWNYGFQDDPGLGDLATVDGRVDVNFGLPLIARAPGIAPPEPAFLVNGAIVGPNLYFVPIPEPGAAWMIAVAVGTIYAGCRRV